jgi:MoxR-like ATPase
MVDRNALEQVARFRSELVGVLGQVIVGQREAIDHVIAALLCDGHVLLTGGAASAKGLLVRSLARAAKLDFRRIQFTPDLMPSDITGSEILEEDAQTGKRVALFVPGPVFTNILMADEINRTPPKTQAALLESMQEKQVSLGGQTRPLPRPFFVIATKATIETEGTYPLPEAQQDRFMLNVEMQSLSMEEETTVVTCDPASNIDRIPQVVDGQRLQGFQRIVRDIAVPAPVQQYIVNLTSASRPGTPDAPENVNKYVAWGAGVRATQYLALGAKARAALAGRDAADPDDVKSVALPVMRHRIGLNFRAENDGISAANIVGMLLESVRP